MFTTAEMARLSRLSPSRIRRCVHAGFLSPRRGQRRRFEYTLHDLLVLRVARTLLEARLGPRRIAEVIDELRRILPPGRDVSSVRLSTQGTDVIVSEGKRRWRLGSGQLLLSFDRPVRRRDVQPLNEAEPDDRAAYRAFSRGLSLEESAPSEAREAYQEALRLDPVAVPALVNLGRLEHVAGEFDEAEEHYREALALDENERTAAFNLALLAEDRAQPRTALKRYLRVLEIDPDHADAHHRLSHIYARVGRREAARRHTRLYREILRRS